MSEYKALSKWIVRDTWGNKIGAVQAESEYAALEKVARLRGFMTMDEARKEYKYFVCLDKSNVQQTNEAAQSQTIKDLHIGHRNGFTRGID